MLEVGSKQQFERENLIPVGSRGELVLHSPKNVMPDGGYDMLNGAESVDTTASEPTDGVGDFG